MPRNLSSQLFNEIIRVETGSPLRGAALMTLNRINTFGENGQASILLVNNDCITSVMINRVLNSNGLKCVASHRWVLAKRMLSSLHFHIIIIDDSLPDGKVEEIIAELRSARYKSSPAVIVLSSMSDIVNSTFTENYRPVWVVPKPFFDSSIKEAVQSALNGEVA